VIQASFAAVYVYYTLPDRPVIQAIVL